MTSGRTLGVYLNSETLKEINSEVCRLNLRNPELYADMTTTKYLTELIQTIVKIGVHREVIHQ